MTVPPFVQIRNNMPTIDIGRMRHYVAIQSYGPTGGFTAAGPAMGWETFVQAEAALEIQRGTDVIRAGQTTAQLNLTMGMWFQAGIKPDMRILAENGSVYVIQAVENVLEMDCVLVLHCIALGANQ